MGRTSRCPVTHARRRGLAHQRAALVLVALALILDAARWALRTLAIVNPWHVDASEAMQYPNWRHISKAPEIARGELLRGWDRQFAAVDQVRAEHG
jgi:hypothetical protein